MKVILIQARAGQAAGTAVELDDTMALEAIRTGAARTEGEHANILARDTEMTSIKAERINNNVAIIKAKVADAKKRGAIAPKDEAVEAKAVERIKKGVDFDIVAETIDGLQGRDMSVMATRTTSSNTGFSTESGVQLQGCSIQDAGKAYVTAREPMDKLIRAGNWKAAQDLASESAIIGQRELMGKVDAGGDFMLRDVIRAADFTDPDSQVGTLATGLVVMRNLGYLVNMLPLKKISTDISSEPAQFGQPVLTRYITPPGVLTWVPGTGFTSDATTISNASAGTTQSGAVTTSGTRTISAPSTTDVTVTMNMFKATEIEFPISKLSSTIRNLFGEQRGAQMYSLAENINQHLLATLFAATWTGAKNVYTKSLENWNIKGLIGLKNALTINKCPMPGRFALLHSFLYDKLLEDANLLTAKSILALINKDASSFESGQLPDLFNISPIESQLSSATNAGALTTWTDDTTPGTTNIVGFAGDISSALFVSRAPQNWTTLATQLGVPLTAAVEIVTEPESGLSVLVFKYADNGRMSMVQRVCLMWGDAQGDPRKGVLLKLS